MGELMEAIEQIEADLGIAAAPSTTTTAAPTVISIDVIDAVKGSDK